MCVWMKADVCMYARKKAWSHISLKQTERQQDKAEPHMLNIHCAAPETEASVLQSAAAIESHSLMVTVLHHIKLNVFISE